MAIRRGFLTPLDLSTYAEAIGDLMDLRVVVDPGPDAADAAYAELLARTSATRPPVKLPRLTTPLPTSDLLPPIHFHGTSAQQGASITLPSEGPLSFVRGVVRLTADDPPEIRWTIVIRYSGEDRWRLEGVQVGGRCSRRGFFGVSETACFLFTCYLVAFLACCVLCSYRYGRPSMSHRDLLCPLPCSLDTHLGALRSRRGVTVPRVARLRRLKSDRNPQSKQPPKPDDSIGQATKVGRLGRVADTLLLRYGQTHSRSSTRRTVRYGTGSRRQHRIEG